MPIQFLVPAFLAGLAALAIPILVHLRRRRRAKVEPFPSLMFLRRVEYQADDRRRIHHWFLLLLRALAIALIVAAFARPLFEEDETLAAASTGPSEIVVLLDRSYSMAVGDHWERAKAAAAEVFGGLGPLDRASLVPFARGVHAPVRSSGDVSRLRAALDTVRLSDEATRYAPALKLAATILEESELPGRRVVMISDLQRTGWSGAEDVRLPPGTDLETVALTESAPENRAVAAIETDRETVQGAERITVTGRVVRTGGEAEQAVDVILEVDGREIQRRSVTLPAAGAATATFDPFTVTDRHTRGTVRTEPDALPGDDARHFVASPGRGLSVLVLDAGRAGGASSLYIERALDIDSGRFDVDVREGGGINRALLANRAVVVLNDRPVSEADTRLLQEFVEAGGGLLVILGERASWPDGADLLPGRPGPPLDRSGGRGERLGHITYAHPVFEIFQGARRGDFTAARFFRARSLRVEPDTAGDGSGGTVLARFDDGSPALAEGTVGDGRVLVWTSTMDTFWNDLALQPVFLPFVHSLLRHTSGRTEPVQSFTAGHVLDITDARAMATAGLGEVDSVFGDAEERVVLTPSGSTMTLPYGDGPHFLTLGERGFYRIRPPGSDDVRPLSIAVNVDLAEADLAPLDPQEVVASLTSDATAPSNADGTEASAATADAGSDRLRLEERERRQSLWRFLLLGAFGLLAVETMVSNRISPRPRASMARG